MSNKIKTGLMAASVALVVASGVYAGAIFKTETQSQEVNLPILMLYVELYNISQASYEAGQSLDKPWKLLVVERE